MDFPIGSRALVLEWPQNQTSSTVACPREIPRHADSGYASQTNTAFTSPVGSKEKLSKPTPNASQDEFAHSSPRSVLMPGRSDLQIVRRDIDYTFNARFREIAPRMQQLLQQSLQKWSPSLFPLTKSRSKRQQAVMSMRLMVVGKTAETAKPTIVVFLSGDQTRAMEAVLKQPEMRRLYMADDGITPTFEVIVVAQEPRKISNQDVAVLWEASRSAEKNLPTLCGVQIQLDAGDGRIAVATVGGVVKLRYGPGDFKLVGMTAGHVLEDVLDAEMDREIAPFTHSRTFGMIFHPMVENDLNATVPRHDWALIEIDPRMRLRPNLMHIAGGPSNLSLSIPRRLGDFRQNGTSMSAAPSASFPDVKPIEVALLSGSSRFSGASLGLLSHIPGSIMLSPEDGFIDVYHLTLDHGQELQDGDSGSWVVNPISLEVYGHVVATDITGDAYVVPLHASLEEMKNVLGVESVSLPGTADLLDAALLRGLRRTRVLDDADSGYVSMASVVPDAAGVKEVEHEVWGDDEEDEFNYW